MVQYSYRLSPPNVLQKCRAQRRILFEAVFADIRFMTFLALSNQIFLRALRSHVIHCHADVMILWTPARPRYCRRARATRRHARSAVQLHCAMLAASSARAVRGPARRRRRSYTVHDRPASLHSSSLSSWHVQRARITRGIRNCEGTSTVTTGHAGCR